MPRSICLPISADPEEEEKRDGETINEMPIVEAGEEEWTPGRREKQNCVCSVIYNVALSDQLPKFRQRVVEPLKL